MVDRSLLLRKLSDLSDLSGQLREYRGITARRYAGDWKTQRIVERTLQMMVEICLDVANHLISDKGYRRPVGYADHFTVMLKIAVLGNWEHQTGLGVAAFQSAYAAAGIHLLLNSTLNIQNLTLFGLDDLVHGRPDFRGLDAALGRRGPALFITHCPAAFDRLPEAAAAPVLAVSGHTHGGQIAPLGTAIVTPPGSGEYVHGWYRRGTASMYVTRGIGTSGVPIRLGARPEMVVMEVEGEGGRA